MKDCEFKLIAEGWSILNITHAIYTPITCILTEIYWNNNPAVPVFLTNIHTTKTMLPSEEFEFTVNSLGAHIETHSGLILRTLSYLTVNSQDDSLCELAVSFP